MDDITKALQIEEKNRAFDFAVRNDVLSRDVRDANYIGNYMFMGEDDRSFAFKNIFTRGYIRLVKTMTPPAEIATHRVCGSF